MSLGYREWHEALARYEALNWKDRETRGVMLRPRVKILGLEKPKQHTLTTCPACGGWLGQWCICPSCGSWFI